MPKRTSAIKKTDKNKAWLRKVKPSSYSVDKRELNKIILIVGEGQTEKLYFESFPVLTLTVEAIDLKGQSKLKLIESTEEIVKCADIDYDVVWCVFDMDVRQGKKEFADYDNAIKSGKTKGFNVAYSNDCFELWFYLHYHFTDQRHHRTHYYVELGKRFDCNYIKEGKRHDFCKKTYSFLEADSNASQQKAIERARTLHEASKGLMYHEQNPITMVFELVGFLNENCRK